jgi:hypothetical protein
MPFSGKIRISRRDVMRVPTPHTSSYAAQAVRQPRIVQKNVSDPTGRSIRNCAKQTWHRKRQDGKRKARETRNFRQSTPPQNRRRRRRTAI